MMKTFSLRAILTLAGALLTAVTLAGQGQAPPLTLLTPPVVRVNPVSGSGTALLRLQNPRGTAMPVVLTAVPSEALPNDARVTVARDGAKGGEVELKLQIPARAIERVAITVDGVSVAGDYPIDLFNGPSKIGTVVARLAAIGLSVETPADGQFVTLRAGSPTTRTISNADPFPYRVAWSWSAEGAELCREETDVPAQRTTLLTCKPTIGLSPREFFRQHRVQSTLTMRVDTAPASGRPPILQQRVMPAVVTSVGPAVSSFVIYLILVGVLVAGGLSSLFLNSALPNFLQRISLREQLLGMAVRIGNVSTNVESRLRVLVRLERNRLRDLLRSRWTLSPEFATVVTQTTAGIAQLRSRVEALQQLDLTVERLNNARLGNVPLTLVEQIETRLAKATTLLRKTDPSESDLRDAVATVTEASGLVDALVTPGLAFGVDVLARAKAVHDAATSLAGSPTWNTIIQVVAWPWNTVSAAHNATTVPAAQYAHLDAAVLRVELMQEYAELMAGPLPTSTVKQQQFRTHDAAFVACLADAGNTALISARRLLRDMAEDVYPDDLKNALTATSAQAGIRVAPEIAFDRSPLTFCVTFYDQRLNDAAARQNWACDWDFGDNITGEGRTVAHYFELKDPKQGQSFTVKALLRDGTGQPVVGANGTFTLSCTIDVRPSRQGQRFEGRVWAEAIKLAAALLIAIFGLVAGAQEQLLKLDIVPGLVAVFLVGFGADTIKNLLTAKA